MIFSNDLIHGPWEVGSWSIRLRETSPVPSGGQHRPSSTKKNQGRDRAEIVSSTFRAGILVEALFVTKIDQIRQNITNFLWSNLADQSRSIGHQKLKLVTKSASTSIPALNVLDPIIVSSIMINSIVLGIAPGETITPDPAPITSNHITDDRLSGNNGLGASS